MTDAKVDPVAIKQRQQARRKRVGWWSEPDEGGRNVPTRVWRDAAEEVIAEAEADLTATLAELDQVQRELRAERDANGANLHELSLIEADTRRGVTDCSTPTFQRVRNIVAQLEQAEAEVARLQQQLAAIRAALDGIQCPVIESRCNGLRQVLRAMRGMW